MSVNWEASPRGRRREGGFLRILSLTWDNWDNEDEEWQYGLQYDKSIMINEDDYKHGVGIF